MSKSQHQRLYKKEEEKKEEKVVGYDIGKGVAFPNRYHSGEITKQDGVYREESSNYIVPLLFCLSTSFCEYIPILLIYLTFNYSRDDHFESIKSPLEKIKQHN